MKISDCNRCLLYARNPHLVCTVHPEGVESDKCMDFRPDPNAQIEEQWSPQGYSWYGDELIADRPSRYSQEEQIQILDTHPFGVASLRDDLKRDSIEMKIMK